MSGHSHGAMDEISAHLDRGWDLLQRGDLHAARISSHKVLELDPESPEAFTLLGAVAAAEGDTEEALEHFRQAMEIDPEYIDPILHAAETLIFPVGDFQEALRLCNQALEVAEEDDELLDATLLKVDAQMAMGDADGARKTMTGVPSPPLPDAEYGLRAGRAFIDLEDFDAAERHLRAAAEQAPDMADAYHGLGLVAEARNDFRGMTRAWIKVRELDLRDERPPWALSTDDFEKVAESTLAELPPNIRALLENVPIIAADYPALELVTEGNDPRMLGFFSGVPYPEKSVLDGMPPHLDCIFLYQRNIERFCGTAEEVAEEVRMTILHESGHFFALTEEELEAMGLG